MYGRRKGSKLKRERHAQCRGEEEFVVILEKWRGEEFKMVGRTISYSSPGSLWAEVG